MTTVARQQLSAADQLWLAIEELTNPVRAADPNGKERTYPALWAQLLDAIDTKGGGGRGASPQPPLNTAALSLIVQITERVERELLANGRQPPTNVRAVGVRCRCQPYRACPGVIVRRQVTDVPAALRAVNAELRMWPKAQQQWADDVFDWVAQARAILAPSDRLTYLRGYACLDCHSRRVVRTINGDNRERPALQLIWTEDGTRVNYVWCQVCGSSRWSADLHAIAETAQKINLTKETAGC